MVMIVQQRGQLCAGRVAVERFDRVADVDLVLQQPRRGGVKPSVVGGEGHDRQPCPGHVVFPQFAHRVVERDLGGVARGGDRMVVVVIVVNDGDGRHAAGQTQGQGDGRDAENGSAGQRGQGHVYERRQQPGTRPEPSSRRRVGRDRSPRGDIKNGNVTITTDVPAGDADPGRSHCPNPNWTEDITDVAFIGHDQTVPGRERQWRVRRRRARPDRELHVQPVYV